MNDDIPFNEHKFFKNYTMYCSYYLDESQDNLEYVRMKIFYKKNEIYNKDLYGDEQLRTEEIYSRECLLHQRNRRLTQLGI